MVSGVKFEPGFKERAVRLYIERRAEHQEESLAASIRQVASVVGMSAGHVARMDPRGRG
jgi:transposase